jgi:hypothetical protein
MQTIIARYFHIRRLTGRSPVWCWTRATFRGV